MSGAAHRDRIVLPAGADSPGAARRFVQQCLQQWGHATLVDDVSLVATELVTNAVLHARSELEVVLAVGGRVRLEVHDGSQRVPALRSPSGLVATGRGLRLVELLATEWGVEPTDDGKVVWCEFTLPARARDDPGRDEVSESTSSSGRPAGRRTGRLSIRRAAHGVA